MENRAENYTILVLFQVESTKERIDLEQLKVKEKIFFYEDVILYEDELADNGIAKLNVKMVNSEKFLFPKYCTM